MKFERLDTVDRILLTSEDSKRLDDWWLNIHEGAFNEFRPVLEEGVIIQELDPHLKFDKDFVKAHGLTTSLALLYFKQLDDVRVYYEIYRTIGENQVEHILEGTKNYVELKSDLTINKNNHIGLKIEHAVHYLDAVTSSHIALMNYMELYRDERERVSFQKLRKTKTKKTKKGKKKNTRPINMVVYNIKIPDVHITEEERQAYKKMKEAWKVRGHWRTLPSGKKTWIKPHIKGNKEKLEPNIYHF
ncbi:hypothetical protein [Evansella cellulosilytica]|uniref:Uncharacterized protein n=1 Tax=Evansella cellulosilytica (strain ATCC 21833 / DSM 2522 / FERM P-1141 / JCM 9156 / N-4) TaxID=649639 RepID=E6TU52_EVAC2|nr:hypothetical protein [Evansella cellulosilytica]ADU28512.1 hypothetical protein Bcell_0224 [Evansella cellulosilytica DSM 2522]